MNCANHSDTAAAAFCRTCGKPLCANCTRDVRGVIYCEGCLAARMEGTAPAAPYAPPGTPYQQIMDQGLGLKVPPGPASGPNPALAGILGAIPFGIGAVYNSQYAKGLAHLLIFAMLIFAANHSSGGLDVIFGFGIAFFWVYQIVDAVRSAKAIQMGLPAPDPFGLAQTFGTGEKFETSKIPAGAVVLIGLGVLFLLHTMQVLDFSGELFVGVLLISLGIWLLARRWGLLHASRPMCTCAQCRMRSLMGPAVLLTFGAILTLDSHDLGGLRWERTWPAILLVVGVVKLLQSSASSDGHIGPLPPGPAPGAPVPPATPVPPTETSSGEVRNV